MIIKPLTASMRLLDPDEAANFRATITTVVEAAVRSHRGVPKPAEAEMARKIAPTLEAAALS